MFQNAVNIQSKAKLYPRHYTIFFLVEDVFFGGVEAWVLVGRTDSRCPCGRDFPLFGRTSCSSKCAVGGFRRGLEGTDRRDEPLRLTEGLLTGTTGGNDPVALVLLL